MTGNPRRTGLLVLGIWMLGISVPALFIRGLHGWQVWGIPGPVLYIAVIVGGLLTLVLAARARPSRTAENPGTPEGD
ncbi:hypothetical protein E0H75_42255 [Kribbella capetownensis]|uniref:Uncharacterized protein n=1 Tax=Kribbella capetownensis TaxID=1572659 RepID=A0A4R0ING1_9ACTN|nr:hypothetical protein [Kribbella capetownensis]TCC33884.1 hypothetical protein E0H75_42255 [Kribbella capetownensis]